MEKGWYNTNELFEPLHIVWLGKVSSRKWHLGWTIIEDKEPVLGKWRGKSIFDS